VNDTADKLLKEFANADPLFLDPDCGELVCILCRAKVEENKHRQDCVWLRATKLVAWNAEQAQRIAGADPVPTQGPKF
jgi:hypothetical protein